MRRGGIKSIGSLGFSLVEVMVAVAVASLVLLVGLPNLARYNSNLQLKSAVSDVSNAMRRARSVATTRRVDVRVSVNAGANAVAVQRDDDGDGNFEISVTSKSLPGKVKFQQVNLNGGATVTFDTRGTPDNPGNIILVGSQGQRRELRLAAGSGAITVLDPDA